MRSLVFICIALSLYWTFNVAVKLKGKSLQYDDDNNNDVDDEENDDDDDDDAEDDDDDDDNENEDELDSGNNTRETARNKKKRKKINMKKVKEWQQYDQKHGRNAKSQKMYDKLTKAEKKTAWRIVADNYWNEVLPLGFFASNTGSNKNENKGKGI